MSADLVRRRALDLLVRVAAGARLDPLLDGALRDLARAGAPRRDAAFLAELVRGTLQWALRYDHLIGRFARRRPPADPRLVALLRLSLHQLVALDGVPPYAVLHQAGELCRTRIAPRLTGFVNGFLQAARRELRPAADTVAKAREAALAAAFADLTDDRRAWLAAWHAHPRWLVDRWCDRWGEEATAGVLAHNNLAVPLVLRVLEPMEPRAAARALADAGCAVGEGGDPRTLVCRDRLERAEIAELAGRFPWLLVQDGTVQEATSWLLGAAAGAAAPVVDLCAAPGGKTRRLAAAWPSDLPLVALEKRPRRLRALVEAVKTIETRPVSVVLADGTAPPLRPAAFGVALLDGPCSGTGVVRHHPEARLHLRPGDPAARAGTLTELARGAAGLLAPGGVLLYATCSLEEEENEAVVDALVAGTAPLEPWPDGLGRWRRTWLPGEAGGDGFFAARLRRPE